ncbi:MAG TPA: aminotransferase class III-fold pyridoxal phosphate-dependent enzyme [Streptosporangiaceae bacterium]|nr:aminotransferase class III-fold pyridoxal phosphate-dependent enzyme [Streptosporangiaceae bacterium]
MAAAGGAVTFSPAGIDPIGIPVRIDPVLQGRAPAFSPRQACAIGRAAFGVDATGARSLGSERDQAFLLSGPAGGAVLKVSNPAEDPAMLDMEAMAAMHAARCDPGLTVALPRRRARPAGDGGGLAGCRVRWQHDGTGYWVRAYDVLPGRARLDPLTLPDQALAAWGETTARLGLALRGFIHPRAIRRLPWDVQHAALVRPMTHAIAGKSARSAVVTVLDRFDTAVAPRWGLLRAQVIHSDLTADNVLASDDGLITGIVDFGDMTHTALAADLAAVLDSLCGGRDQAEMFRVARLVLDGYERLLPLEPVELELLGDLWAARAAVTVAIGSWRAAAGLEDPGFAERFHDSALAMIDNLLTAGWARTARLLGAGSSRGEHAGRPARVSALARRRDAVFGPAMEPLSYAEPIEMASASGVWMTGTDGRRYLDMYNNVVCVGHAHPRVTSAVGRQWRVLNTNLRYLHASAVELAERLVATCPPGLDTVLFVNSGSEANDLAWRLACWHTGNAGGLCTEFAYHGITAAMADFSPEVLPGARTPPHVQTWAPPDSYRGLRQETAGFEAALGRLDAGGFAPAATIFDGVLQSDGIFDPGAAYVRDLVRLTHAAGGLWIADEVQGGHGRTGEAMWSFQRFGIVPDVVTLGKPMGNGQPVGAVITRREVAERFARDTVFFSTFAGNQVSMAAAHAVLDVLDDERVLDRTRAAGTALRAAVRAATSESAAVGDVRGVGLANAIEIVTDQASKRPDQATATALKDALRRRGVLVGTTGRAGNVLKVRPPLAFTEELVPVFTAALTAALADCQVPAA